MSTTPLASIGLAAAICGSLLFCVGPERKDERATARIHARGHGHARPLACVGVACDQPMPVATAEPGAASAQGDDDVVALWRKFALNALLAPLLDDSEPPRWVTPTLVSPCADTSSVTLDGKPLDGGAPLPPGSFVLHWRLADCAPLGPLFSLRGSLAMQISREPKRISALISSSDLVVTAQGRPHRAAQPFTTTLSLDQTVRVGARTEQP